MSAHSRHRAAQTEGTDVLMGKGPHGTGSNRNMATFLSSHRSEATAGTAFFLTFL